MKRRSVSMVMLIAAVAFSPSCRVLNRAFVIIKPAASSALEDLAAQEIRRYLYLRTGQLAGIEEPSDLEAVRPPAIIVAKKDRFRGIGFAGEELRRKIDSLADQEYLLLTIIHRGKPLLLVAGGDDAGTLYGAYRVIENLGVRFYLHGDVIPDGQVPLKIPVLEETGKPLFRLRGIHPFHDFPEGPDWWNAEDYKAIFSQLPKLRMNFFALHTYPEGRPNAEPTVWIGQTEDVNPDGTVHSSYPSSYQNTARGNWGYEPAKTCDFHYGAPLLFESDPFGPEVMAGMMPEPKTPEEANEIFNRTAAMLRDAFTLGRSLGVKTCVGTEMPLTIPEWVKKRLLEQGKNPADAASVKEIYQGLFSRIKQAYPLDYYWLWTDENWTWSEVSEKQIQAVVADVRLALEAASSVAAPFSLATCGWVLGPPSDRTLFDRVLPKEVAVSCINREVGKAPVDPMFGRISGRSEWAIPWLEDDPALTSPQLWAGRMRKDAVDALAYGCDGLMGIHWRTRLLGPNVAALAAASWEQRPWGDSLSPLKEEGPINGVYVSFPDQAVAGTKEQSIYQDYRDRVYGYHVPVPNGTYDVILKFCEGEIKEKGRRVFDISLQGKKVLEQLDIFARAGNFRALDFHFKGIGVAQGKLEIEFADRIHYPAIAGIVIEGPNFSKKINCGGGPLGDYEADWPATPRYAETLDFYIDWATHEFGPEAAEAVASIFAEIDGHLPQPNVWTGPGGLKPDPRPWEVARADYQFVEALAKLEPLVQGVGNKARFAYWLASFSYMREMTHLECLWAEYNAAAETLKAKPDEAAKAKFAEEVLLLARERMVAALGELYGYLLATVSNTGELGTVANWEQHLIPALMHRPGEELRKALGREMPPQAQIPRAYAGPPRVIVPTVRTLLAAGETLSLKVIILAQEKPTEAALYWREMGKGDYASVPLRKLARGVYKVTCPETEKELEYYVKARWGSEDIYFPATAPSMNQTVVRKRGPLEGIKPQSGIFAQDLVEAREDDVGVEEFARPAADFRIDRLFDLEIEPELVKQPEFLNIIIREIARSIDENLADFFPFLVGNDD